MDLLKDIRYIFQIPLEWFKRVDARVFGDHPGSGVKFEPASDGSRAVMLDFDVLDDRYSGGGTVKTVDGHSPDDDGNVETYPESPTSKKSAVITGEGTASWDTTKWTYDGTNGLQLTMCTRVFYDHTDATPVLYGFYRTFTFDKKGRLYSVSAETRYEIDTPVVGNLTT